MLQSHQAEIPALGHFGFYLKTWTLVLKQEFKLQMATHLWRGMTWKRDYLKTEEVKTGKILHKTGREQRKPTSLSARQKHHTQQGSHSLHVNQYQCFIVF